MTKKKVKGTESDARKAQLYRSIYAQLVKIEGDKDARPMIGYTTAFGVDVRIVFKDDGEIIATMNSHNNGTADCRDQFAQPKLPPDGGDLSKQQLATMLMEVGHFVPEPVASLQDWIESAHIQIVRIYGEVIVAVRRRRKFTTSVSTDTPKVVHASGANEPSTATEVVDCAAKHDNSILNHSLCMPRGLGCWPRRNDTLNRL